jgi:hypothetical protein
VFQVKQKSYVWGYVQCRVTLERRKSRFQIERIFKVKPAQEPQVNVAAEEEQPVLSFTRLIESAPSVASFGGWGPKVAGMSGMITRFN